MGDVFVYAVGVVALLIAAGWICSILIRAVVGAVIAFAQLVFALGLAALFLWVLLQIVG
jgi:hypothetical protein